MLLFEAAEEFKERLKLDDDFKENIPEYFEAMEIAVKCIEAQYRIIDYLESFNAEDEEKHKNDTYSRKLVMEIIDSCRFDYISEDDDERRVEFKILQEHCKHQNMIKDGKKWCSFKNGQRAMCWSDWQECSAENCFLATGVKEPVQKLEQISIKEFMEGKA